MPGRAPRPAQYAPPEDRRTMPYRSRRPPLRKLHAEDVPVAGVQFGEAEVVVEAQGAPVRGVHVEVNAARSAFPQRRELQVHEPTARSAALEPGEQVDVQVRRKACHQLVVGAPRVVDQVGDLLVPRPALSCGDVRLGVAKPQRRPPLRLHALLERPAVQRAKAVAAHPVLVFDHERQPRLKHSVGRRIEMAEQVRVAKLRRRVGAVVPGLQADPVQVAQVAGTVAANDHGGAGPGRYAARSRAWALGPAPMWSRPSKAAPATGGTSTMPSVASGAPSPNRLGISPVSSGSRRVSTPPPSPTGTGSPST